MVDDRHKRHALRQRMHRLYAVPTEPAALALVPSDPPPAWTRAAPARPVYLCRPWWRRLLDLFLR